MLGKLFYGLAILNAILMLPFYIVLLLVTLAISLMLRIVFIINKTDIEIQSEIFYGIAKKAASVLTIIFWFILCGTTSLEEIREGIEKNL